MTVDQASSGLLPRTNVSSHNPGGWHVAFRITKRSQNSKQLARGQKSGKAPINGCEKIPIFQPQTKRLVMIDGLAIRSRRLLERLSSFQSSISICCQQSVHFERRKVYGVHPPRLEPG